MNLIKNYYAGGNTWKGFYSLYENLLQGLERLYIIKGGPGTGKSSFIRKIGNFMADSGYNIDFLHCSSDNDSLDGVIIPELQIAIVDGTAPHIIDPKYPGAVEKIINFGQFWDEGILRANKDKIIELTDEISVNFRLAYEQFSTAKAIHDEWEQIYLAVIDFNKANQVTESLITQIFSTDIPQENAAKIRKLFFGAATPNGAVNFIENITADIKKRYIVKGRPGSGKSTMMRKIGQHAEKLGLSVDYFPCAFDPDSLDMIVLPNLSVAIIDGTAPHVIDPSRENDQVVDMFALCIDPQVENERKGDILDVEERYKAKMLVGTNYLKKAKQLHDELEQFYIKAMDFNKVNQMREEILQEIIEIAELHEEEVNI